MSENSVVVMEGDFSEGIRQFVVSQKFNSP